MQETFAPWMTLFHVLHSEMMGRTGVGTVILQQGELMDEASLLLLASLDGVCNEALVEKHKHGRN